MTANVATANLFPTSQPAQARPSKGLAFASFVIGLLSLALMWIFLLGLVLGLIAVALGIVGLKRSKPFAIIGIVAGGITTAVFALIMTVGSMA